MPRSFRYLLLLFFVILRVAILSNVALAQSDSIRLVSQRVDDRQRVTLKGNVHPMAQPRYDQGAVSDSFPAERMLLLLQRSPERETALRQFIKDAHTLGSPAYHNWLTPDQFGALYGPAESDLAAATVWLQSRGFSVAGVSKGRISIEFSGNAGQVREAFGTEIHTYMVQGEVHHAIDRDPQIPAALAPLIAGITSMNDFQPRSNSVLLGEAGYNLRTHQVTPQWTQASNVLALSPSDFAVQYNLGPIYSAGINGAGVTIGIVSEANADATIVANYRSLFGFPASPVKTIIDGTDPGVNGATREAYLDLEVSGAVAPGASINFYVTAGTAMQGGVDLAALRAVDDNEVSVISASFALCEQQLGSAGNQFWSAVWEQAAAQGQTVFVSSGDGGSAGCDDFTLAQPAHLGLGVNGISSTPWNISVGGTDFFYNSFNGTPAAQSAELSTFWNLTPSNLPTVSLLKPVPEQPWNDAFGLNISTGGVFNPGSPTIIAGSGGASSCISGVVASDGTFSSCSGGYPKPSWQTGAGVPTDGVRDIPDISLFAANAANDSFYPICLSLGSCVPINGTVSISGVGGTSASSPAMAGIMALINQKFGRQGQANFTLYPLAAQHPSIFHDITLGTIDVPCQAGTPSCTISTQNDNTNGFDTLGGYRASSGYDQATGLGSFDAALLLNFWNSLHFISTNTTLSLSQTSFTHGTPVTLTVGVTGNGGTPSGDVALLTTASPSVNVGLGEFTLQNGAVSNNFRSLPGGQYTLSAQYAGDAIFAPSSSNPVTLSVSPEASTTSVSGNIVSPGTFFFSSLPNGGSAPYGSLVTIDAQPAGVNAPPGSTDGIATGIIVFTDAASSGNVNSGPINLASSGIAEWVPTGGFPAGTHSVTATYAGDTSFNASTSTAPFTFTITKGASSPTLSAIPTSIALGANETLTMSVITSASATAAPPTGTATFSNGATVLGTVPVQAANFNPHVAVATLTTSALPVGANSITATYNGDANNNPSTTSVVTVTVKAISGVAVGATPNPINEAQSFAVTANVPSVAGIPAPSGSVTFSATGGGKSSSVGATLVNGTASASFAAGLFGVGTVSIDASYSGDANYTPSDTPLSVTVTVPFAISGTPVTILTPGATTGNVSTVTISPVGDFTGPVTLSCALTSPPVGAQNLPGCAISSPVNVSNTSAVTATMTISSTAATSSASLFRSPNRILWVGIAGGIILLAMMLVGIPARKRTRRSFLAFASCLSVVVIFAGCGGSGTVGGGGGGNSGTTPGSYTFTVTAKTPGASPALPIVSADTTVSVTIQ